MSGNARIGSTVIVSPSSKSDRRVLHVRLGRPFTSALQEPHLAALQFQRTARSGASLAWIQWSASRTTIPSSTGTSNSTNEPSVDGVPRKTLRWASAMGRLRGDELAKVGREGGQGRRLDVHLVAGDSDDVVLRRPPGVGVGIVDSAVRSAALTSLAGAAGDRLRHDHHVAKLEHEA